MKNSKLLLVDDSDANLDILVEILGDKYNICVATSGELALKIVSKIKPDLILLDIIMPGLDGYEVCRRLKGNPETTNIPIIFVTVKSSIEDEQKGLDLGAIDYIVKPFSPPIVQARVKNHLLIKHQHDQLEKSISVLEHEKELLQQKADLGILAGSFAHDLSNIFCSANILQSLPQTIPESDAEWQRIQRGLELVAENINLGLEISRGFTNYLYNIEEQAQIHSLNEFTPVLGIYARKFKGKITKDITTNGTSQVYCKGYQIKRVIINLLANAIQSLESRSDPEILFKTWADEKYAHFSIQDNGTGIPDDIREQIFDEFFTTKSAGTGLGLSLVKQILDNHNGKIEVRSTVNKGTEFIVSLPVAKSGAEAIIS